MLGEDAGGIIISKGSAFGGRKTRIRRKILRRERGGEKIVRRDGGY